MRRYEFIVSMIVLVMCGVTLLILCMVPWIEARVILLLTLRTFGISLLVAALITILWNYRLQMYFLTIITQYLGLSSAVNVIGISNIYPDRASASSSINRCLNNTRGELKLLGGSLTYFLAAAPPFDLRPLIERNLNNQNFSIKILLPIPESSGVENREHPDVDGVGTLTTLNACFAVARDLKTRYLQKVDIHTYEIDPMCALIITTNELFLQPYDFSHHGWSAPVFQSRSNSSLYQRYVKHFNHMWNNLSTEPPER